MTLGFEGEDMFTVARKKNPVSVFISAALNIVKPVTIS